MEYLDRNDVSNQVIENVKNYLKENLPKYTVVEVTRHSNHPDDHYLYHIIAKTQSPTWGDTYACWTSWNDSTQSLNFGHYNLDSLEIAQAVSNEYYFSACPVKGRGR